MKNRSESSRSPSATMLPLSLMIDGNLYADTKKYSQWETQTGWPTRQSPSKATCTTLTCQENPARSLMPQSPREREQAGSMQFLQAHSKLIIFILPHIRIMCTGMCETQNILWEVEKLDLTFPLLPLSHTIKKTLRSEWTIHIKPHLLTASSSNYPLPAIHCHVMLLLSRINKQQTWLLAASCVPRWCRTATKGFLAISLPRAWEKNLTCQCLPSNADLLRRRDFLKQTQIMHHVSKIIRHSQRTYVIGEHQLLFLCKVGFLLIMCCKTSPYVTE